MKSKKDFFNSIVEKPSVISKLKDYQNLQETEKKIVEYIKEVDPPGTMSILVPDELAARPLAYVGMGEDLKTCKRALEKLTDCDAFDSVFYYSTLVILYGKCFADAKSTNSPKLETDIFSDSPELLEDHNKLISLRNDFIAHRGKAVNEFGKAIASFHLEEMTWGIQVVQLKTTDFNGDEFLKFHLLIDFVLERVREKYSKNSDKILAHIVTNFSHEKFSELVISNKMKKVP